MKTSQIIIEDVRQQIKSREEQKKSTLEELAVLDAQIDKIDELITSIEVTALPYVNEINAATTDLYNSYVERITSGCRNDLYWENTGCYTVILESGSVEYCTYQVKLNPSLLEDLNFTGIKYYKKPLNRDYDSEIIEDFSGDILFNSKDIIVKDIEGIPPEIQIGDTIVDNLDNQPVVFKIGDLPKVVGFGTTQAYIGVSSGVVGGIGTGSTIFAHYGSGISTNFEVGYKFERVGIVTATIIGFATTQFTVTYYDTNTSQFVVGVTTSRSFILDSAAVDYAADVSFNVGVLSSFPAVNLSTSSVSSGSTIVFTAIRYGSEDRYDDFNYTRNPHSPLKIGIINSSNAGIGNSVYVVNNGYPPGPEKWKTEKNYIDPISNEEINPEPNVGADKVTYSIGDFSWPTITIPTAFPTTSYATLGATVTVPNEDGITYGVTSVSPTSPPPSLCSRINNDISTKTTIRNNIISTNTPIIQNIIGNTRALRNQRNQKELYAWSLVQSAASLTQEIKQLKSDLKELESLDFSGYES